MKTTQLTIATICILALAASARADELYVPDDYNTIQAAIDAAVDGDTVIVADGTYTGEGNHDIDFLGKAITVKSENGPQNCIIDCNTPEFDFHRAFYFGSGEDANSVLDGFTITHGRHEFAGGILCIGSGPTITNCIISNNWALYGGGIHCYKSSPNISNCTMRENWAYQGGGISSRDSSPVINNCAITDNNTDGDWGGGGGINCVRSNANIINCIIRNNSADIGTGGGIFCEGGNEKIINCTIIGNTADVGGGIICLDSSLEISDCNLTGNQTYYKGGAIYSEQSTLNIARCNINDNSARDGGGIHCVETTAEITDCNINSNSAYAGGGGIYCVETTVEIIDCNISGNWAEGYGGGICGGDSNSVISSCLFSENISTGDGGAICNWGGLISNCTIIGNSAGEGGGGMYCRASSPTITNCMIAGNSAGFDGGGINGGAGIISNCTITANSAESSGGGINRWEGIIKNCLITVNSARGGGGIYRAMFVNACTIVGNRAVTGGGLWRRYRDSSVTNCIIWSNYAPEEPQLEPVENLFYNCIQDWTEGGPGNIDADPCFVEAGYWDVNGVWVEADYRLLSGSPCIDAGDPNYLPKPNETDLDGEPRVVDGDEDGVAVVDMGAYEFIPSVEAKMKLTPQTLSCTGKGKFIKAHIILPEEIFPEDIDVNTPAVADPPDVESEYIKVFANGKGAFTVEIAFDRAAFCEALTETAEIEVTVYGYLTTSREFYATDTIRIRAQSPHRRRLRAH